MNQQITLMLVDDHQAIQSGMVHYFDQQDGFTVVKSLHNGDHLMSTIRECSPDIILLDMHLQRKDGKAESGMKLAENILTYNPSQKVVIYTGYNYPHYKQNAFQIGVKAFISKYEPLSKLAQYLQLVSEGIIVQNDDSSTEEKLTKFEINLLHHISEGLTNQDISEKLSYSRRTIEHYITVIYEKLQVTSRIQSVVKGMKLGYLPLTNEPST
ncbi:hypothetical protein N781_08995 [Pontibacillus halophilus JSM 076056 = DSM 19796]|uniref:LuxR family transcriptional regulator n=1 Tax=Pontibacillus halophilus JSM 076056 = DSM 19796 TaxID=1385510 RepID=A0A0A5GCS7_9BACI|nr:response regulator transcription factor [Pontibacillus halophilus]KGX89844.1 hypothetical protein N781_08995 [Pontibacillus halophilus JSM 076056 = DSM 19796]